MFDESKKKQQFAKGQVKMDSGQVDFWPTKHYIEPNCCRKLLFCPDWLTFCIPVTDVKAVTRRLYGLLLKVLSFLFVPSSLPYRWQPAVGAAGGEEGGAADRGGRQPEPRVPAHPRPPRVPLRRLQGGPGRRQRRHQGEQGETFKNDLVGVVFRWRRWHEAVRVYPQLQLHLLFAKCDTFWSLA